MMLVARTAFLASWNQQPGPVCAPAVPPAPAPFPGAPARFAGAPAAFPGAPARFAGAPARFAGAPTPIPGSPALVPAAPPAPGVSAALAPVAANGLRELLAALVSALDQSHRQWGNFLAPARNASEQSSFDPSTLWPASNHRWMAPGARVSTDAAYGKGLDFGALRNEDGRYQILVPKLPTPEDQRNSEWVDFDPKNQNHMTGANAFNRYGPGWSYGPGHNMHNEVEGYYEEVYGRKPDPMTKLDIEHDRGLWSQLVAAYNRKIGFQPPR